MAAPIAYNTPSINYGSLTVMENDQVCKEMRQTQFWQTRTRGTNEDEYDIYAAVMEQTGEYCKTYDEWMNS
jgi:hypothetical protein